MDKEKYIHTFFKNRIGILATMHKKEKVISPILTKELDIRIQIPKGFNTDRFGTFTRDIERMGNQIEAARHKAQGAMVLSGGTLAFASEGIFGPHPENPFLPLNREIILLLDKDNDLEIIGEAATIDTNYRQCVVKTFQDAYKFALSAGFPQHGVVIKFSESTRKQDEIIKGLESKEDLKNAFELALKKSDSGNISIETDMRALFNPTRMKNIEAATHDLVKNIYHLCPKCFWPGFKLTHKRRGLRCEQCTLPTRLTLSLQYECKKCGYSEEKFYPAGMKKADPMYCSYCNP